MVQNEVRFPGPQVGFSATTRTRNHGNDTMVVYEVLLDVKQSGTLPGPLAKLQLLLRIRSGDYGTLVVSVTAMPENALLMPVAS